MLIITNTHENNERFTIFRLGYNNGTFVLLDISDSGYGNYIAPPDPIYEQLFRQACAQWEKIITLGLPTDDRLSLYGPIDDLRIEFGFTSGPFFAAIPGIYRETAGGRGLPSTCTIVMPWSTYAQYGENPREQVRQVFYDLVLHEIAHALGYEPKFLEELGLVQTTRDHPFSQMTDEEGFRDYVYYVGTNGVREFNSIFGAGAPFADSGNRFLMETYAQSGTFGAHLSEVYATYLNLNFDYPPSPSDSSNSCTGPLILMIREGVSALSPSAS